MSSTRNPATGPVVKWLLIGGFCVAVRQLLAAHQAQEVKTIGDALMLRTGDSARRSGSGCALCTTSAPGTASHWCE
jgi:hypothetical protein